jgi:hypothetical protein
MIKRGLVYRLEYISYSQENKREHISILLIMLEYSEKGVNGDYMNLYRYSKIDCYLLENLKKNQIYFQTPKLYNDPYEFIFKLDVADEIYEDFIRLVYSHKSNHVFQSGKNKEEVLEHTRNCFFAENVENLGVACFAVNGNDDIMWAHYADSHKGICIEFDKTRFPLKFCEPVKYVDHVFTMKVTCLDDLSELNEAVNGVFYSKGLIWSYENEWRLIQNAGDTLNYEADAIKSITFGFYCTPESKEAVIKATSHLKINYYNVARAKDVYRIERRQFNLNKQ